MFDLWWLLCVMQFFGVLWVIMNLYIMMLDEVFVVIDGIEYVCFFWCEVLFG